MCTYNYKTVVAYKRLACVEARVRVRVRVAL